METTAVQLRINGYLITLVSVCICPAKTVERELEVLIQTSNTVILAEDFNS
jgi:hypothetical protein